MNQLVCSVEPKMGMNGEAWTRNGMLDGIDEAVPPI